jgi:hypothetical protein
MEEQEQLNSEFQKTTELINEDLKYLNNLDNLIEEAKQVILNFDDYTKEEQEQTCNEFIAEFGSNTDFTIQINNIYSNIELYLQKLDEYTMANNNFKNIMTEYSNLCYSSNNVRDQNFSMRKNKFTNYKSRVGGHKNTQGYKNTRRHKKHTRKNKQ